jgi:hypothetical protein
MTARVICCICFTAGFGTSRHFALLRGVASGVKRTLITPRRWPLPRFAGHLSGLAPVASGTVFPGRGRRPYRPRLRQPGRRNLVVDPDVFGQCVAD